MTTDEKLAAILAAVQTDPGNRGLARDPHDNLFNKWPADFSEACRGLAEYDRACPAIITGFYIPQADPPAYESDGPLGAIFLARALRGLRISCTLATDPGGMNALRSGWRAVGLDRERICELPEKADRSSLATHYIFIERVGPGRDGLCRTMRGRDVTEQTRPAHLLIDECDQEDPIPTIGIGDGGNEIGMGKVPHETIVKNIPNGDLIHCRVPTDHLIVVGVSNWGAYALAAGVYVLCGVKPSSDLFDPDREHEILEVMVREGPLVDGVTGKQTATVDGLTWDEYAKPLIRIREILES
jgi:hypothetical protein